MLKQTNLGQIQPEGQTIQFFSLYLVLGGGGVIDLPGGP